MEIKSKNISTNGGIYMLSKKFLVAMFSGTTKAIAEDMIFTILVNTLAPELFKGLYICKTCFITQDKNGHPVRSVEPILKINSKEKAKVYIDFMDNFLSNNEITNLNIARLLYAMLLGKLQPVRGYSKEEIARVYNTLVYKHRVDETFLLMLKRHLLWSDKDFIKEVFDALNIKQDTENLSFEILSDEFSISSSDTDTVKVPVIFQNFEKECLLANDILLKSDFCQSHKINYEKNLKLFLFKRKSYKAA